MIASHEGGKHRKMFFKMSVSLVVPLGKNLSLHPFAKMVKIDLKKKWRPPVYDAIPCVEIEQRSEEKKLMQNEPRCSG